MIAQLPTTKNISSPPHVVTMNDDTIAATNDKSLSSLLHYDSDEQNNDNASADDDREDDEDETISMIHRDQVVVLPASSDRPSMLSDRPSMLSEPSFDGTRPSMLGGSGEDSRDDMMMLDEDDSSSHDGTSYTSNNSSMVANNNLGGHIKVPHKRGKRKKYQKYTPEDRIAIGKYCFEHGPAAARKAFQDRYPEMSESVTRGFRDKYKQMIGESAVYEFEQRRQKDIHTGYNPPPRGRPRKYKIIEQQVPKEYMPVSSTSSAAAVPLRRSSPTTSCEPPNMMLDDEKYRGYHHNNNNRISSSQTDYQSSYARENTRRSNGNGRPSFVENEPPQRVITREEQLKIGRYCSINGVMKALQEFHREYPGISEAIIFDFHKRYQRHSKEEQDHMLHSLNNNNHINSKEQPQYHSPSPPPPPQKTEHAQQEYPAAPQVFVLEGDQMAPTTTVNLNNRQEATTQPSPTTSTSSNSNREPSNSAVSPNENNHHFDKQRTPSSHHSTSPTNRREKDSEKDLLLMERRPKTRHHSPSSYTRSPPQQNSTSFGESRSPPYIRHYDERYSSSAVVPPRHEEYNNIHHQEQLHRHRSRSRSPGDPSPQTRMHSRHSPSPRSMDRHRSPKNTEKGKAPPIIHYPRPRPHSPRTSPHSPPQIHRSLSSENGLRRTLGEYTDTIPPPRRTNGAFPSVEYPYDRKDFHAHHNGVVKPSIHLHSPHHLPHQHQPVGSSGRSKRFKYQKYTPEDRYNIGKLCNDIGLGATVKVYREQFPRLNESVVRTFRNKYRELLEKGGGVAVAEAIERKPSRRSISTLIEGEVVSQLKQFHSSQIELSENFVIAVAENVIATKHQKEADNIKGIVTKEWANSLLWKHKLLDKPSGNVQGVCCERCKTVLVCPKCPP